jgi:hypothetical protein
LFSEDELIFITLVRSPFNNEKLLFRIIIDELLDELLHLSSIIIQFDDNVEQFCTELSEIEIISTLLIENKLPLILLELELEEKLIFLNIALLIYIFPLIPYINENDDPFAFIIVLFPINIWPVPFKKINDPLLLLL